MMAYADIILQYGDRTIRGNNSWDRNLIWSNSRIRRRGPELVSQLDPLLEKAGIYRTYILRHPFDEEFFNRIKAKAHGFVLLQSIADDLGKRPIVAPENKSLIETMKRRG